LVSRETIILRVRGSEIERHGAASSNSLIAVSIVDLRKIRLLLGNAGRLVLWNELSWLVMRLQNFIKCLSF